MAIVFTMMLLRASFGDAQVVERNKDNMSFHPKHFRELVVRPALKEIKLWSKNAEELLLLTAAVETDFGLYLRQNGTDGGWAPGRGVFSIEPTTFKWLLSIPSYDKLLYGTPDDLIIDLKLSAKAARLRYRVVEEPLPAHDDLNGLAKYWKKWYNASPNGGTIDEAIKKYKKYVKK